MNTDDQTQIGRLARMLQEIEHGHTEQDDSSLSEDEMQQLQLAKRALGRLAKVAAAESSTAATSQSTSPLGTETDPSPSSETADLDADLWSRSEKTQVEFPRKLGRFDITSVLGRGGFGVVLQATDPKIDHNVALKIPRSELLLSNEGRERLLREARAATVLSHPNIVPIYESGLIGVVPYISFGYCSGPTLSDWLTENGSRVSPRFAARILAKLADAVQHAHSRGVVHRDLKPSNVMLAEPLGPDASEAEMLEALQIADFGLATAAEGEVNLTRTGSPIGTPAYMSPEQARGDSEIDAASDVFSLGVMLYELLTGTQPFRGTSDLATLRAVEQFEPPAASTVCKSVAKDLSAIAQQCLQKRPGDRYPSARALEQDLRRFLENEPVRARPIGVGTRLVRWCSRNPAIAGSLLMTIASLAIGLAFSLSYAKEAKDFARAARQSAEESERRYSEALALAGLFHNTYDSFRDIIQQDLQGKDDKARQLKQKLVNTTKDHYRLVATKRPTDRAVLREYVDMLRPMAQQLQLLGDMQTSSEIWKEIAGLLESEFPEEVHVWATVMGKLVEDYTVLRQTDEAVEIANRVVAKLSKVDESDDASRKTETQLVHALTNASIALKGSGDLAGARAILDDAEALVCDLENSEVQAWPTNRTWARLIRTKCEQIGLMEAYDELLFLAPIGIAQYEALREDPKYVDLALDSIPTFYDAIATVRANEGQYTEAIEQLENGLALREQLIQRHPEMGWLYYNVSNTYQRIVQIRNRSGDHAGAIRDAEQQVTRTMALIKRFPELKPALEKQLLEAYWILGHAQYGEGKKSDAIHTAEQGIELVEQMGGGDTVPLSLEGRLGTLLSIKAFASEDPATQAEAVDQAIFHLQNAIERGASPLYQVDLKSAKQLKQKLTAE